MDTIFFLVQQMMTYSIPLLIVALGALFTERSGVNNIALEGIMIIGGFASILRRDILAAACICRH
jgi:simple sugar transport system permease protein